MKHITVFISICLFLSGCDAGYRDSPKQQVEDYKICVDGGMVPYRNGAAEIMCAPGQKAKP